MKVFKITFDTAEEALEEEYEIRDGWGSIVDTAIDRNMVYIAGPKADLLVDDWYKGRNVEELEMSEAQFDRILNPKKQKMYEARVVFISEDAAFDAMNIWKNVQNPSIRPMSAFDPFTQKQLSIARRMADVEVKKDGETLIIRSASKAKVREAVELFNEDEDSVAYSSKPKRISESDMSLDEALDLIDGAGLIVEMTEEQRAARRARAKARRAEAKGKPVNYGTWAVIAGSAFATPDFFREHKPEGTSDEVLRFVKQNYGQRKSAKILGFYPTRKKAKEVAISVMEKFLAMCDTAYGLRYNCPTLSVVEFTPENKRWSSAIRGPGDSGYVYDSDKEISELLSDMRYDKINELEAAEEEAERKKERDRELANNRRNPDHQSYFNVFKHH